MGCSQFGRKESDTTERLSTEHSKIKNKARMSMLANFIQHSFKSPSHSNHRKKTNFKKKILKLSLFADDMMQYKGNTEDATRKHLKLISEFGKVAGYKINTQKSLHLYTLTMKNKKDNYPIYHCIKKNTQE